MSSTLPWITLGSDLDRASNPRDDLVQAVAPYVLSRLAGKSRCLNGVDTLGTGASGKHYSSALEAQIHSLDRIPVPQPTSMTTAPLNTLGFERMNLAYETVRVVSLSMISWMSVKVSDTRAQASPFSA